MKTDKQKLQEIHHILSEVFKKRAKAASSFHDGVNVAKAKRAKWEQEIYEPSAPAEPTLDRKNDLTLNYS